MNMLSVIEPEILELLPAKTMLKVIEQAQNAKKYSTAFQVTVKSHADLFRGLEELDIDSSFCLTSGDINISFTGTGTRLGEVWGLLRRNGYASVSRPRKGEPTFYAHWRKDDFSTIFMSFSSSVCRRVQVGTKTETVPVYEVQCGDMPEIEAEIPAPSLTVIDGGVDDVPF